MQFLHLTDGAAVIPDSEALLLATADERFAAITGSSAERRELGPILRGHDPVPGTGVGADVAAAVTDWGVGILAHSARAPREPWHLADALDVDALQTRVAPVLGDVQLVVTDVLDDPGLLARDGSERPWLPVHRELGRLVAGPVLNGPSDTVLTWADVRFRRLAASPARPQLRTLWQTWSDRGTEHDLLPSAVAMRSAADRLLDLLDDGPQILLTHQVVVPCAADEPASVHPVLPVPQGLMAQVPA